jgi:hypothetical protein
MHINNLITEDDTAGMDPKKTILEVTADPDTEKPIKKKRKRHNSAMLTIAKARNEAVHTTASTFAEGDSHPIGTNITYKKGGGVL